MTKPITNVAASVHARLLNRAKAEGHPFNELLQYYGMERFLYRLSRSAHSEHFVLKGARMLQFWGTPLMRAIQDIDVLGREAGSVGQLVTAMKDCHAVEVEDDDFPPPSYAPIPVRPSSPRNSKRRGAVACCRSERRFLAPLGTWWSVGVTVDSAAQLYPARPPGRHPRWRRRRVQ